MKTKVTVLPKAAPKFYKKDNYQSKRVVCQCIVHQLDENGEETALVGVLNVPEALCPVPAKSSAEADMPDVPAGDYFAEYGLRIDYKTKELGGVLIGLQRIERTPVNPAFASKPAESAAKPA